MYSKSGPRRRHSPEFKMRVLAACDEPGASVSGVALAHGLNANVVRKWRSGRGLKRIGLSVEPSPKIEMPSSPKATTSPLLAAGAEFVAIEMRALPEATPGAVAKRAVPSADPLIHVELRRGPLHINVRWPTSAASDCAAWLRELTTGVLK